MHKRFLVQLGVNTTTEIWLIYLWHELYEDFCRDSLGVQLATSPSFAYLSGVKWAITAGRIAVV